jgi:hypothetical protein
MMGCDPNHEPPDLPETTAYTIGGCGTGIGVGAEAAWRKENVDLQIERRGMEFVHKAP